MIWLSFGVFAFLVSFIIQIIVYALTISWTVDSFVVIHHAFPLSAAFGLGIAICVISMIFFVLFVLKSSSKVYASLWMGLTLANSVFLITISSPASIGTWIDKWDEGWMNVSYPMLFQLEKQCCGWKDFKDRSIMNCPFTFRSGCKGIVEPWIRSRFSQTFLSLFLILGLNVFSIVTVCVYTIGFHVSVIWSELEIPFIEPNLY